MICKREWHSERDPTAKNSYKTLNFPSQMLACVTMATITPLPESAPNPLYIYLLHLNTNTPVSCFALMISAHLKQLYFAAGGLGVFAVRVRFTLSTVKWAKVQKKKKSKPAAKHLLKCIGQKFYTCCYRSLREIFKKFLNIIFCFVLLFSDFFLYLTVNL